MSFMASMPLSMRFINTCCNCTRSAMILGRSLASSPRIEIEYRLASLRSRTIISRMSSFTSTNSRCRAPFLNSKLMLLMMSAARITSLTTLEAASCASAMSGSSRPSHRKQVLASVTAAEHRLLDLVRQGSSQLAHRGHSCDVRKISLYLPQSLALFIRPPAFGHVDQETHEFAEIAGRFENRMTHCLHVSRCTARKDHSVMHVDIRARVGCALESFHDQGSIVWMNTLMKFFEGRFPPIRIEAIQAGVFLGRVEDLSLQDIARPAARMGELLRFR